MRKTRTQKKILEKKEREREKDDREKKWDARSVIKMMRSTEHIFVFSPI